MEENRKMILNKCIAEREKERARMRNEKKILGGTIVRMRYVNINKRVAKERIGRKKEKGDRIQQT